ncbi:flippase-like domain-containing protein [Desulforhopalus vacuolatus]|uniref:lysylphosphatidylglycerol synthase transmembrane domain-containing protein n=1 Tax=Desulforhopalus vacuolatus TaxID=40414 RepID=UPI0019623832|nr:lysylphosphatidylglycerol synthase transmembrane domain-containing protein [Desulforhopalus vacuolatus]MBM9520781.1 flippase-like domain-containing protein [Desulforhopalus vacuolatus]
MKPKLLLSSLVIILLLFTSFSLSGKFPDLNDLRSILKDGKYGWIFYSFSFFCANFIRSLRWRYLLRKHVRLTIFQAWSNFQWLFMIKSISPFMTGELARVLWLKSKGGSGTFGVGVFLFEKITDVIVLFFISIVVVFYSFNDTVTMTEKSVIGGMIFSVLVAIIFADKLEVVFRFFIRLSSMNDVSNKIFHKRIVSLQNALLSNLSPMQRTRVIFMTLVIWLCLALGMSGAMYSLGELFHWTQGPGLVVSANFAGFISPLPANIGTYQFAGSSILVHYGVNVKEAISLTVILQMLMLFQVIAIGLITFWLFGTIEEKEHGNGK